MNDQLDMMFVLFVFFIAISYMNFLSVRLKNHSGWTNVRCNPLNLFSNSLFQTEEESNKEFKRCVVQLSTEATTQLFKDQTKLQTDVLTAQSGIRDQYKQITEDVSDYKKSIQTSSLGYAKIASDLATDQAAANQLNTDITKRTSSFLERINEIFDRIKGYII